MDQLIARRRKYRHKDAEGSVCEMLPSFFKCKSMTGMGRRIKSQLLRVLPTTAFAKNSLRFLRRCTKPSRQEFQRTSMAIGVGFLIMGTIGFAVKLIHIPITNIIMA